MGLLYLDGILFLCLVRMIQGLWARVSKMWLLGELGILLFCSPGFWDVGGLLRALSSPGGQSIISVFGNGNAQYAEKPL